MQFKGRGGWKRSEESKVERTFLFPDNALPSYGSTATAHEKALFLGSHTDDSVNLPPVSALEGMSVKDGMRLITATEVVLPPVNWYERLYIPGLIKARPSPNSNAIHTTKYTFFNFIFKNLWEQFHRVANIYFLFIAVMNFVPAVEAVAKEVAFLPLLFVLGVTAIRDIFEDYRRYRSDKQVNRKVCMVYNKNSGSFVGKQWRNIRVGDVVRLLSDDVIPADIVVLQSSDPTGICYIETANIDGETNLKQRQVAPGLFQCVSDGATSRSNDFNPANFTGKIYCEPPHNKIYEFNGYIETADGGTTGINKSNLLLRGCVLRNTLSVVGVVVYAGHETKSLLNNSGLRPKRSKLERDINIDVIFQVVILIVLCFVGAIVSGVWNSRQLDTNSPYYPFTSESLNLALESFVRFWTFIILFQVIVPVSLYVTIEIVKLVQVYLINFDLDMYYAPLDRPFQCRALNISEDLGQIQYIFSDKTGTLTENKMEFRCCSIGGLNYPHSLAGELKGHLSQTQITGHVKCNTDEVDFPEKPKKTELDPALVANISDPVVRDFFTVLAICNTVVVSTAGGRVESAAGSHLDPPLTEGGDQVDLQALKYEAESPDEAALVHAARDYGYTLLSRSPHQCSLALPDGTIVTYDVLHMLEFDSNRKCMSIIVREQGRSEVVLYSKGADSAIYRNLDNIILDLGNKRALSVIHQDKSRSSAHPSLSASVSAPHTLAALCAEEEARDLGMSAGNRTGTAGNDQGKLEVRSSRPNRNVDGGGNDGGIQIMDSSSPRHDQATSKRSKEVAFMRDKTQRHLDNYAKLGLRTLCMAKRVLTEEEYHRWSEERHRANIALKDREELMSHSAYSIERQLELLGATGIEDQLQTNVPEAIASLQKAGIKVWVLTGDKQETAINIGYSSQLITPEMEVIILNAYSLDDCRDELMKIKQKLMVTGEAMEESDDSGDSNTLAPLNSLQAKLIRLRKYSMQCTPNFDPLDSEKALVVDGATLVFALDPSLKKLFLEVAEKCKAVLCCRSTPLQKAAVVELVKSGWKKMTLAIGDGANDVSMIQKADVGVGIAGREGMQAVMASDFAMARFHFLVKLLLVHGHWCYDRLSRLILYFFYKNITYAILLFWYQFFNGFTGTSPIDSVNLLIFNLIYTSLPIMIMAVADQDLPAQVLLEKKVLYRQGQCSTIYTRFYFWMTVIDAFYQSAVVFFVAYGAYYFNGIGVAEFGFVVNTSIVIVVSFHLAVETLHWTVAHHFFLWGSVVVCFVFNYVYSGIDTRQRGIDTFFVFERATFRAEFWFVILLSIVIALLPRVLVKVLIQEFRPTPVMATQAQLKKKGVRNKPNPSQTSNAVI